MKYLIVDDEHELYQRMFADLFKPSQYDVEEIPRMVIPLHLRWLYQLHHSDKINRRIKLPGKMLWRSCYRLHSYPFDPNEQYCVLFLNGSLRYHFSEVYLKELKKHHPNVKLAMILYDSFSNPTAARSISMIPLFDYVFSFDAGDCARNGFERIYSTFSVPKDLYIDEDKKSAAFFIGFGMGRLKILQDAFERITSSVPNCKLYVAGVHESDEKPIKDVVYNLTMPYEQELQMAYNTECIIDIVKEGQTGVSLRTCEAIAFNKKLLTNNVHIQSMPFYDSRFMSVFKEPKDIDIDFLTKKIVVKYNNAGYFSPLRIIDRIDELEKVMK